MTERITKTQRWLDLIALLLNRKIPVAVEEIMERIPAYARKWAGGDETSRASARRMFERDKDDLRAMGVPIESTRYDINYGSEVVDGYRILRQDFYLPYLRVLSGGGEEPRRPSLLPTVELAPEEAEAALEALRGVAETPGFPFATDARSALSKLAFDLDADRAPLDPVLHLERPGTREVLDRLRKLADALLAGKKVRFRYHGIRRGAATEREVEPYGLFLQRDWYLVANDPELGAVRVFRVSRMEEPVRNALSPKSRDYTVPSEFDLRAFVGRRAWELAGDPPIHAEVLFRFPSSLLAGRGREGELIAEHADGSAVRAFEVRDPNPFLRWVLGFAGDATVVAPPELRDAFRRMASEVASLYADRHA